ncbi:MAG: chromosome segregation protein SMC [Methanomicrobiales archaeon]|jgi:chromosome segregation protein|nr:chromosome segregation protein SMC [Methanomicrobiales archaeon]
MYITALDIDNFKSFSRKTHIPVYQGFTVISGPNGSGKSNIIDCILFVLTLSSSRYLRAEKLTDLINVNSNRNTAEVQIEFSDGTKIRRKIKRTKNGYYNYLYLNEKSCRQSELLEFLAQRGIIPHGYNVVMQGDINRIIEMSEIERRKILDEIAGVSEFDQKRDLARNELDRVHVRIQEETVHLSSLESRQNELEKQREQALRHRELTTTLDYLTRCRLYVRISKKKQEYNDILSLIFDESKKITHFQEHIDACVDKKEHYSTALSELDATIAAKTGDEYRDLIRVIATAEASIESAQDRIGRAEAEKQQHHQQLNSIFAERKRYESSIEKYTNSLRELMIDKSTLAITLSTVEEEKARVVEALSSYGEKERDIEQQYQALDKEIREKKELRSVLIRNQDVLLERSRMRNSEKERFLSRLKEVKDESTTISDSLVSAKEAYEEAQHQTHQFETAVHAAEKEVYQKREQRENLSRRVREIQYELHRKEAQQQASGRYGKAIEAVLSMEGVHGTLASLGRCKPEYATALNIAAGNRLNFVVVEHVDVAADAISYLKIHNLGRVTFLPLNKLRLPSLPTIRKNEAIIGLAVDLLEFHPKFSNAFLVTLGGTVVMRSLSDAQARMGQYRMVTLDGSLIERSGSMTGGSLQQKSSIGFGMSFVDDLHVLSEQLAALSREEEMCEASYSHANAERDRLLGKRVEASEELVRSKAVYDEYERRLKSLSVECVGIEAKLVEHSKESDDTSSELARIEKERAFLTQDINECTEKIESLSQFFEGDVFLRLNESLDQIHMQIEEIKRRISAKDSSIADEQREKSFAKRSLDALLAQDDEIRTKITVLDEEVSQLHASISTYKISISETHHRQREFTDQLAELQSQRDTLLVSLSTIDEEMRKFNGQIERNSGIIIGLEEKKEKISEELAASSSEAYEVTDMSLEEIEQKVAAAEYDLSRLGPVNMYAIEEYEVVCDKLEKRKEKVEVLSREHAEICERIDRYSLMKHDAFMQTYTAISDNFREIFAKLTVGTGDIVLDNKEEPFLGGLSFAVRPHHKNVHLLASLSGGEKSLTTLAFIFSIQKYLPAPFYAFDEVDMNLDTNNVERIADMIRDLCKDSQFLSISLRKPMIDASDRLIGVTVREDKSTLVTGVSIRG